MPLALKAYMDTSRFKGKVKKLLMRRSPASGLTGMVDEISETFIRGWAVLDSRAPELVVKRNDKVVTVEKPNVFRSDLTHLYGGHDNFGFEIRFSPNITPNDIISVTDIKEQHLTRSPLQLERPSTQWLEHQDDAKTILGFHFIRGAGIEIGALNKPTLLSKHASVTYVDRYTREELRRIYPELHTADLVEPDILDEAETLGKISDNTYDFVISSHVLEHLEDPILAIKNHIRVLKPGGILFLALPERTRTSDMHRQPTDIEHLIKDHLHGPNISRDQHYYEWAYFNEGARGEAAHARATNLQSANYSIHFHCWSLIEFLEFVSFLKREHCSSIRVVFAKDNQNEFLVVLQKSKVN